MIKLSKIFLVAALAVLAVSCVEEKFPMNERPTIDQVNDAPNAFQGIVDGLTSTLAGTFIYSGSDADANDFGYSEFFIMWDIMGQDLLPDDHTGYEWFHSWYAADYSLGPGWAHSQMPWSSYYKWINSCNTVLALAGEEPAENQIIGAGLAYAMRAMYYMDLARMYAPKTYALDKSALTVPIRTETSTMEDLVVQGNATNEEIWDFIISDLDKAEEYIADYERGDVYTPDLSVVYGLKARAYLVMENWVEAEKYAKLAQAGYTPMSAAQYTDRMTAFNTPNSAWMMGMVFLPTSDCILLNDADSSWGSQMFQETVGGYANYGWPKRIDAHLYDMIPETDARKNCYIDPSLNDMEPDERTAAIIAKYSDYPDLIDASVAPTHQGYAYLPLKFRAAGGTAGRSDPYKAFAASVPMMRVEEMMLIEAEAAGMQNEARGIELLKAFAALRDTDYQYNTFSSFRDNVWMQRRIEFWGEGMATFDIKRLNKGIIRSYEGTNHDLGYRWNTTTPPNWMNLCIVDTETNPNPNVISNPAPEAPTADSPAHVW